MLADRDGPRDRAHPRLPHHPRPALGRLPDLGATLGVGCVSCPGQSFPRGTPDRLLGSGNVCNCGGSVFHHKRLNGRGCCDELGDRRPGLFLTHCGRNASP